MNAAVDDMVAGNATGMHRDKSYVHDALPVPPLLAHRKVPMARIVDDLRSAARLELERVQRRLAKTLPDSGGR